MKTAYSFIRWSTKRQSRESSDSKRRQLKSATDWCQANDCQLSEQVFIGDGESAYKAKHLQVKDGVAIGALARFIQAVDKGFVKANDVLCIDSVDRWGRQEILDALEPFTRLLNLGIGIVFTGSPLKKLLTRELINKEPHWLQWLINEMIRSWTESDEKSRKVKEGKAAKKEKMKAGEIVPHNNMPKYFTYVPITDGHGKYIHNANTNIVLELKDGILAGKSLYEMAKDLNNRGTPTFRRKVEWSPSSIRQILRNRTLIGEYLGNANYVEPIIDEDTFLKVQNIINNNVTNRGKKGNLVNVFRGLCFCAECGQAINSPSSTYNGISYRYLRCSNYVKGKTCAKSYLRLELVERDFLHNFLCKDPYKLINGDDIAEVKAMQNEITTKTAQVNEISLDIAKVISTLRKKSMPELDKALLELDGERDKLKHEIDVLNSKVAGIQDAPTELDNWFIRIIDEDENGEPVVKSMTYETIERITKALTDNEAREKLRVILPSMIGRIIVDSKARLFRVFNRMGRMVYQSGQFRSQSNNSERWRQSLKKWTKRKTAGGTTIVCKRYQRGKSKVELVAGK